MKTSAVLFMTLALAGPLSHASVSAAKPTEVEVCTATLHAMMTQKTNALLSCSNDGLGSIRLGEAYARGWRVKASQDASALCNQLSPCLLLVLER